MPTNIREFTNEKSTSVIDFIRNGKLPEKSIDFSDDSIFCIAVWSDDFGDAGRAIFVDKLFLGGDPLIKGDILIAIMRAVKYRARKDGTVIVLYKVYNNKMINIITKSKSCVKIIENASGSKTFIVKPRSIRMKKLEIGDPAVRNVPVDTISLRAMHLEAMSDTLTDRNANELLNNSIESASGNELVKAGSPQKQTKRGIISRIADWFRRNALDK